MKAYISVIALLSISAFTNALPQRINNQQFDELAQQNQNLFWKAWASNLNQYVTSSSAGIVGNEQTANDNNLYLSLANGIMDRHNFGATDQAEMNWAVWHVADAVPGPVTTDNLGSFFNAYKDFVNAINTAPPKTYPPASKSKVGAASHQQNLRTASRDLAALRRQAQKGYEEHKKLFPEESMTLDDYITQNFPRIRSLEKDVASSQSHIQTDNTRTFGPGFQKVTEVREKVASAAKDTAQTQYNMPCRKDENATLYCPHYSMQATDAFASWKSTYGNNQRSIEFAIDTKSLSQKETKWTWGGSATIPTKIPFVSVSASVEGNGEKLTRTTSDFAAKLSFSAISSFPVRPGQWYDPSLISNYKNSVDKSKMPQGADFFGPDGSLSRTVQRVIVGYKPRVNISFSREFWDEMKTQTRTKGSINVGIGPISFPVFKMDKTVNTHDKVDDKHSMPEVSFEDNSENAFVVLGFVSSRVGQ